MYSRQWSFSCYIHSNSSFSDGDASVIYTDFIRLNTTQYTVTKNKLKQYTDPKFTKLCSTYSSLWLQSLKGVEIIILLKNCVLYFVLGKKKTCYLLGLRVTLRSSP